MIKVIPAVNQTLGIPEAEFLKLGVGNRDNPDCKWPALPETAMVDQQRRRTPLFQLRLCAGA